MKQSEMENKMDNHSVQLTEIIDEFKLSVIFGEEFISDVSVTSLEINRPGLQLTGYLDHFGEDRVQIMGNNEMEYLKILKPNLRFEALDNFFKCGFPCVVLCRGITAFPEFKEVSEKYKKPVLSSNDVTSNFLSGIIGYLNVKLARRTTMHATLVEVYGEGILLVGKSGVGKSETTLELIKRGHRLVADDQVEISKVSDKTLVGTAPEIIRHMMEIRGIGFIDIKHLYGVGSVKLTENIKVVINLENWQPDKEYDRVGMDTEYTDVLGIAVPCITIPVRPGRNLAVIVEVAAMNNRQKIMGYNAAKALNERVFSFGELKEEF